MSLLECLYFFDKIRRLHVQVLWSEMGRINRKADYSEVDCGLEDRLAIRLFITYKRG